MEFDAEEKHWLRIGDGPWKEVTRKEYIEAEWSAGFRPKEGCGDRATSGFGRSRGGSVDVHGKVTTHDGDAPTDGIPLHAAAQNR